MALMASVSFALLGVAMSGTSARAFAYQKAGEWMIASIVEYLAGMPVVKIRYRTGESFAGARDCASRALIAAAALATAFFAHPWIRTFNTMAFRKMMDRLTI